MVNYLSKFNKINFSYNYLYLVLSFLVYGFYSSATGLNFFNKFAQIANERKNELENRFRKS